jgi:hypothetical protein
MYGEAALGRSRCAVLSGLRASRYCEPFMILAIYMRPSGSCLVLPDCFLPSGEAGAFAYLGELHEGAMPSDMWSRIREEVDARGHAELSSDSAARRYIRRHGT